MTTHVAIHMWGAWSLLPIFLAGCVYGYIWKRGISRPHGSWKELRDVLMILVPGIISAVILISAIFEYRT